MKERGFSIIELLAVIVLIAAIAVIATPQVIKLINISRINSFKSSAEGLLESAEQAHTDILYEQKTDTVIEFNLTTGANMDKIETKGSGPTDGYIRINPKGYTQIFLKNDKYCAVKGYDDKKIKAYDINDEACKTE